MEKRCVSQNHLPPLAFPVRITSPPLAFLVRITSPPLAFPVRISSQNIDISTICNVRMMSERIVVVRVPCMVRWTLVVHWGGQDSHWQVHYSRQRSLIQTTVFVHNTILCCSCFPLLNCIVLSFIHKIYYIFTLDILCTIWWSYLPCNTEIWKSMFPLIHNSPSSWSYTVITKLYSITKDTTDFFVQISTASIRQSYYIYIHALISKEHYHKKTFAVTLTGNT